jgi:hypothetical protein
VQQGILAARLVASGRDTQEPPNALEDVGLERKDLREHAGEPRVRSVRALGEKRREAVAPPLALRIAKGAGMRQVTSSAILRPVRPRGVLTPSLRDTLKLMLLCSMPTPSLSNQSS